MFKKLKNISLLFFSLTVLFLSFSVPSTSSQETLPPKSIKELFKLNERVVLGSNTSLNLKGELNQIANIAKEYCKDEIDPATNELISEGYFRWNIDQNSLYLEVDEKTGYTIGEGNFTITYSKKCPAFLPAKAFKDSGSITGTLSFSGHKKNNKVKGNYRLKLKIPTVIGLTKTIKGQWTGNYNGSQLSSNLPFSIGAGGLGFNASFPFNASLSPASLPFKLIEFDVLEDKKAAPVFLNPYKAELFADGEQKHDFTLSLTTKAKLINKKTKDTIEIVEVGVPNKDIKIKMSSYIQCCSLIKPPWGTVNGKTKNITVTTNEKGLATFLYLTPRIEEGKFESARISLQALHKNGNPTAYVNLKPGLGRIRGKLIDLDGNPFLYKTKIQLRAPDGKVEEKILEGKKGEFEFVTKDVAFNYTVSFFPEKAQGRRIGNLEYDVDLGEIVIGTPEDYQKAAIKDVKGFLKDSGLLPILGNKLDQIKFDYGNTGSNCISDDPSLPCYKNGIVYLPNEKFWSIMHNEQLETLYHEIFHGIHTMVAYDDPNWAQKFIDLANKGATGRGAGGGHAMWVQTKAAWGLDNTQLAYDEAISHLMSHLFLKSDNKNYLRKAVESESGLASIFQNTKATAPRDDYYQLGSVTDKNRGKDGASTEGKVVAFLLDYYQFKGLTPAQIMQDFFITQRDYQSMGNNHSARDINQWITSKIDAATKDGKLSDLQRLYSMAQRHNINLSQETLDTLNDNLGDKTDQDTSPPPDNGRNHSIGGGNYHLHPNANYNFNAGGRVQIDSGKAIIQNGGTDTPQALIDHKGTRYSTEVIGDKTIVRVGEGEVEIYNRQSGKKYLAVAGEEIEVQGNDIHPTMTFDPKSDPDLKPPFFSVKNLIFLGAGLLIIGVLYLVFKKFIKKK